MAAPKTVATYDLDGSTREFDFSFDYLSRTFVQVTLIGTERRVLALGADYTFVGDNRIRTSESYGPPDWGLIEIRRVTPTTERLVSFQDASILRADDLNLSDLQVLHVAEEARDAATETIGTNNFGHLDARGRRLVNLGNAVDRQDAFTYGQYQDDRNGTFAAKQAAEAARDKSREWATSPDIVEGTLRSSKYYSEQAASSASASATSASASATSAASSDQKAKEAANSATAAAASASASATSAASSDQKAKEAANSATAAAASEQAAAGFAGAVQGLIAGATPSVHRFIGDGVQTEFDLGVTITDPVNAMVFLDGANKEPVVDYTVDGSVLKFEEAPADGVKGVAFVSPNTALAIGDAKNIVVETEEGLTTVEQYLQALADRTEALKKGSVIEFSLSDVGAVSRLISSKIGEIQVSIKDFGAIGDGQYHPLSERFSTLAMAQVAYPKALSLTDTIDWAAAQRAADYVGERGGGVVYNPPGMYLQNRETKIGNGNGTKGSTYNNLLFCGAGSAYLASNASATSWKWIGEADFDGAMLSNSGRISGGGVVGIHFDCDEKIRDGLVIKSWVGGLFDDLLVRNFRRNGVEIGVIETGGAAWYTSNNEFSRVVSNTEFVSRSGYETCAWKIDGAPNIPADPHRNFFKLCVGGVIGDAERVAKPRALYLGYTDSSTFIECDFQRSWNAKDAAGNIIPGSPGNAAGSGVSLVADGTRRNVFPLNMMFYGCALIGGYEIIETPGVSEIGMLIFNNMTTRDWESAPPHPRIMGFNDRGAYFGDTPIKIRGDGNGLRIMQQDQSRYWDVRYKATTGGVDNGLVFERSAGGTTQECLTLYADGTAQAAGGFNSFRNTGLADDAVYVIEPSRKEGILAFTRNGGVTQNLMLAYDCLGTPLCVKMSGGGSTQVDVTTGVLNGTTGVDGRLTISTASDGKIYIENRTGAAIAFRGVFL